MADAPVVHIGENSPERMAYVLMRDILFSVEQKDWKTLSRKAYLDTYSECLQAVCGNRPLD